MSMTQLSKNFTLEEMCSSTTADIYKIKNEPNEEQKENLNILCNKVLQPTRDDFGKPIHVNSGFRSAELNKKVGGKVNSYHLQGKAADLHVDGRSEGAYLSALLLRCNLTDLVILEKRGKKFWVHVQWSYAPRHKYIQDFD